MHGSVTPSTHESAVLEQWMSYPDLASVRTETEDPIPLPEVRFGATHAPITGAHNLPTNDITAHVGCGDPNEARMADAFVGESNASLGTSSDNAGSKPDHAIEGHIIHAEPLSQPFVPSSITFSDFDFGSYETPGFDLSAMSNATESDTYSARSLGVPSWLVEELAAQFFDKVQNFLPVFHRPRFYERYISQVLKDDYRNVLPPEDAFVLNGMMALSARFSESTYFSHIEPSSRGDVFGSNAKVIYDGLLSHLETPTLPFLQGCIVLGFYLLSSKPSTQAWLVCGTCSRIACELGLDKIDEELDARNGPSTDPGMLWTQKEELRRAWWCVWELEVVASTIYRRPHTITKARADVKLPVSDKAWFADQEVASNIIPASPLRAWQTLRDCQNQDERAWFLVGNYLIFVVHDMLHHQQFTTQDVVEIETAITGFTQSLPRQFRITSGVVFDAANIRQANWIVSTTLMLLGSRIFLKFIKEGAAPESTHNHQHDFLSPFPAALQAEPKLLTYSPYVQNVLRILHEWPPEFIGMNTPFISTLLLGPAKINLRILQHQELAARASNITNPVASSQKEILRLAIKQVATHWKFGSVLLDEF